jgi:DNA-binding winged helix-turn-helix (wHTH) protein
MRLRFAGCVLDLGTRELFRDERRVAIFPKAFQLLELLVSNRPNAISKATIHESLWPGSFVVDGNLANLVSELREALGDDARNPKLIRTVQRFGYAFTGAAETGEEAAAPGRDRPAYRLLWGEREVALPNGSSLIGRDADALIWIDDFDISRRHAKIVIDESGARLEDLGSKNGTFLQGEKVTSSVVLNDGDTLRVGRASMVFRSILRPGPTATADGSRRGE